MIKFTTNVLIYDQLSFEIRWQYILCGLFLWPWVAIVFHVCESQNRITSHRHDVQYFESGDRKYRINTALFSQRSYVAQGSSHSNKICERSLIPSAFTSLTSKTAAWRSKSSKSGRKHKLFDSLTKALWRDRPLPIHHEISEHLFDIRSNIIWNRTAIRFMHPKRSGLPGVSFFFPYLPSVRCYDVDGVREPIGSARILQNSMDQNGPISDEKSGRDILERWCFSNSDATFPWRLILKLMFFVFKSGKTSWTKSNWLDFHPFAEHRTRWISLRRRKEWS
jgi:hypothetical protein